MKDCFDELDVEQFEIVATLDSHTSDICRGMDGKHLRMQAWTLAIVCNYLILIVVTLCIYGMPYLNFMAVNMFTVLILFLVIFHWKLLRFRKENHE